MPLDPSIILGLQQPQMANPMDIASKAMAMQNLSMQNQVQRQQFNDEQSLRNAYANNTSVDQNGNPSLNRAGIMSDLAKTSPTLVPKVAAGFQQMDAANLTAAHEKVTQASDMLNAVQTAPDEQKQTVYNQVRNSQSAQLAGSSQWPQVYDPGFVNGLQSQASTHQQIIENQMKQQGLDIQGQEANIKTQELGLALQKPAKEAFTELMNHAETSRQLPDVKQAYSDRYNAQKVLDLVGGQDPNHLSPNMVQLVSGEVAKIAQGGVPQTEALQNITPNDRNMLLSQTKQYMTSHPEASQQGAFVKVFQDYAKTIQSGAQKVINSNLGTLGQMYKSKISPDDYQNFQEKVVNGNPYKQDNPNDLVNIKLPDGTTGTIPRSSKDQALARGATLIP